MSHLIFCMKQKLAAVLRSAKREEELNSALEQWSPNCGVGPICEPQNDSVDAREKVRVICYCSDFYLTKIQLRSIWKSPCLCSLDYFKFFFKIWKDVSPSLYHVFYF